MYYLIYKTTNNVNGKIYIGKHRTNNIDDGSMGSGTLLKLAILKYGVDSFTTEILHYLNDEDEMNSKEREIVNEDFVKLTSNYNIDIGGKGGFYNVNLTGRNHLHDNRENSLNNILLGVSVFLTKLLDDEFKNKWIFNLSNTHKQKYLDGYVNPFIGRMHDENAINKMRESHKKTFHQQGVKNSQFGTMWIHNLDLKESKKIKQDEFPEYESLGWLKGRKMKF